MKALSVISISLLMAVSSCCCENSQCKPDSCDNNTVAASESFGLKSEEMEALMRPVELYIESGRKGSSEDARKAFAPLATMSHMEGDSLITLPIQALYDYYDQTGKQECGYKLTACSVDGDVAMVRIESVFGDTRFTDIFSLLKQGEEWKIVSKIFTVK